MAVTNSKTVTNNKTVTGSTIAEWRKSKGMTQQALAESIRMSIGTVRRWEQERTANVSGVMHTNIIAWAKKAGIKVTAAQAVPREKSRSFVTAKPVVVTKPMTKHMTKPMIKALVANVKAKPAVVAKAKAKPMIKSTAKPMTKPMIRTKAKAKPKTKATRNRNLPMGYVDESHVAA